VVHYGLELQYQQVQSQQNQVPPRNRLDCTCTRWKEADKVYIVVGAAVTAVEDHRGEVEEANGRMHPGYDSFCLVRQLAPWDPEPGY